MAEAALERRVWPGRLGAALAGVLVALGSLSIGGWVVSAWTERQILNTDNWVQTVGPLPKQKVVSDTLGTYVTNQVFSDSAVQDKIKNALPEQAGFLAAPLTNQLKSLTQTAAQKAVASDAFQTIWTGANRLAMDRLLATARGQTPPVQAKINERFTIDISSVVRQVGSSLGNVSQAIPALQPASNKIVSVTTDLRLKQQRLHQIVQTTDVLARVLPWASIALILGALALSRGRRRTAMAIVITSFGLLLVELIAVRWLRQSALGAVQDPANTAAVGYIFDTLLQSFLTTVYWLLGLLMVVFIGLIVAGPARWAVRLRSLVRIDRLRDGRVIQAWHVVRMWVHRWGYWIGVGAAVIALVSLALFVTVTVQSILNAVLIVAGVFALVYIIGSPPWQSGLRLRGGMQQRRA